MSPSKREGQSVEWRDRAARNRRWMVSSRSAVVAAFLLALGAGPAQAAGPAVSAPDVRPADPGRTGAWFRPDPKLAAGLTIGGFTLGLCTCLAGAFTNGAVDLAAGGALATLALPMTGHFYAGDPRRGLELTAIGSAVSLAGGLVGMGTGLLLPAAGPYDFRWTQLGILGVMAGGAGWIGYMATDAHRVAREAR